MVLNEKNYIFADHKKEPVTAIMYNHATAIGLIIEHTLIRYGIVRYDGQIIWENTRPSGAAVSGKEIFRNLHEAIRDCRVRADQFKINPLCIGIGSPGIVDPEKGVLRGEAIHFRGWMNIEITSPLAHTYHIPVYADNAAKLIGLAEYTFGPGKELKNVVYLHIGKGIGGAIFIHGKLYRGTHNAGGELGLMTLSCQEGPDRFGVLGSFESLASEDALVHKYLRSCGLGNSLGEAEYINTEYVLDRYGEKEKGAIDAIESITRMIGIGLSNIIHVFSPDMIIMGGILLSRENTILDLIRRSAYRHSFTVSAEHVVIEKSRNPLLSGVLGAGIYALERIGGQNN